MAKHNDLHEPLSEYDRGFKAGLALSETAPAPSGEVMLKEDWKIRFETWLKKEYPLRDSEDQLAKDASRYAREWIEINAISSIIKENEELRKELASLKKTAEDLAYKWFELNTEKEAQPQLSIPLSEEQVKEEAYKHWTSKNRWSEDDYCDGFIDGYKFNPFSQPQPTPQQVEPPTLEQFNAISDLRLYLRRGNKDYTVDCLHYLGDDAQKWWNERKSKVTPQQVKELKEKYWSPFVEMVWTEKFEFKHEALRFIREKLFEPMIAEIYNYKPKEVVGGGMDKC